MGMIATLFGTRGTISRTQMWLTSFGVQIAWLLIPNTPVIQTEHVKIQVWAGSVEGERFHFAPPADAADWLSLMLYCVGYGLVLWVLTAALVRRLNAHGRSPYWLLLLPAFLVLVETEIGLEPGPNFSVLGLAFLLLCVAIVVPTMWGTFETFFRKGVYEGGATDTAGDLRGDAAISGTPAP
jgi:uncharacterized membrane protein YhaH (DUF805 family)